MGAGATGAVHIGFAAIAKKSTVTEPYIVANELVCNGLAQLLLLPCPPGALVSHSGESYYATLNFNMSGMSLPPADCEALVQHDPRTAWGIALFDTLIMNEDRHDENVSFDETSHEIQVFDHSHAFLGTSGDINSNLSDLVDKISIGAHCIAAEITTAEGFAMWCDRIKSIPDFLIDGLVDAACEVGIPVSDRQICVSTLRTRRDRIDNLIKDNLASFPKLPAGAL